MLTDQPIHHNNVTSAVQKKFNGAVVTFLGTTRDISNGKKVLRLEYEAYSELAEKMLAQIIDEAKSKFGVSEVSLAHRIGRLEIGEISLVVAVGSEHRKAAFLACQYIVDRIKILVPIWKKEIYEDGEIWVGNQQGTVKLEGKK
jgi:molybdopterin synthase catalytic subunit